MDYVILILILLIVVVLFLGLVVLSACTTDEMWEEIDNSDLAHKKRNANFVWTDEKTNKLD